MFRVSTIKEITSSKLTPFMGLLLVLLICCSSFAQEKEAEKDDKPEKKKKGTVKRLSRKEYQDFINAAYEKSSKVGLMMQTLYETAARVDEFTSLNANDVYFNELRIVIRSGKGDKRREVPIEEHLGRLLSTHLKDRKSGPIFRTRRNERYTNRRIQQIVKEIAANAKTIV